MAWWKTYGLPVVISNCSNNYGPNQFPEKLIPLMIKKALAGEMLPIYGNGQQVRDWLHVEDHARALWMIFSDGRDGEKYNVGGDNELTNLEVVRKILTHLNLDETLIKHVADRPGHDVRYAIDATKIITELDWEAKWSFEAGLRETIAHYEKNAGESHYQGERLGL